MIEVFIAFDKGVKINKLGETLNAWDTEEYEPVAVQVKDRHNSRMVRVAAEAIAKADYLIASIGSKPPDGTACKKGQGVKVQACSPRVH